MFIPILAAGSGVVSFAFLFWTVAIVWGVILVVLWTILPFLVLRMMWQNNELIAEIRALRKAVMKSPLSFPPATGPPRQNKPGGDREPKLPAAAGQASHAS